MDVAGVDGCPGGWIVVWARADRFLSIVSVRVASTFAEVLDHTAQCIAVGVDIPIGLEDNEYWRRADLEARRVLGRRASSVFPAPVRATFAATAIANYREAYAKARELSFDACGKKISAQANGILKKVKEVNEAMTQQLQEHIIEVHPEVSFNEMSRGAVTYSKKKPEGQDERRRALAGCFTGLRTDTPRGAAPDDFLDACAAAWTAWRFATGQHGTLPLNPPLDSHGLRMEIVY